MGAHKITQSELRRLFTYRDGHLYWNVARQAIQIGHRAGVQRKDSGYRVITIDQRPHPAHRLIYLYHHGRMPTYIDHIDRDPRNNRIKNLRAADSHQNQYNSKLQAKNTSGASNVCWHKTKRRWMVTLNAGGKRVFVGYFAEKTAAVKAATAARTLHHEEFAR